MRVRWTIVERPTIYSSCLSNPPKMLGINRGRQGKVGPLSGDGPNAAFFYQAVIVCLTTQLSILTTLIVISV